jgi:hypothetical protein
MAEWAAKVPKTPKMAAPEGMAERAAKPTAGGSTLQKPAVMAVA